MRVSRARWAARMDLAREAGRFPVADDAAELFDVVDPPVPPGTVLFGWTWEVRHEGLPSGYGLLTVVQVGQSLEWARLSDKPDRMRPLFIAKPGG